MLSPGEVPRGGGGRRLAAWVGRAALLVLGSAATVYGVWLACNLVDSPARPLPEALQVPPWREPTAQNLHLLLAGVQVDDGQPPAVSGLDAWRLNERRAEALKADPQRAFQRMGEEPPSGLADRRALHREPATAPWQCPPGESDRPMPCVDAWWDNADALAAQRAEAAAWGERCEVAMAEATAFDEPRPRVLHPGAEWLEHVTPARNCTNWWHTGATLALKAGNAQEAVALLAQADRLLRSLQGGAGTRFTVMVSQTLVRRHFAVVAQLARRDPVLAAEAAALLEDWPAPLPALRRAVVTDFHVANDAFLALRPPTACDLPTLGAEPTTEARPAWPWRALVAVERWHCTLGVGMLPEATTQELARGALAQLARLDRLQIDGAAWAALEGPAPAVGPASSEPDLGASLRLASALMLGTRWRNGRAQALIDINDAIDMPRGLALRAANVELTRRAAQHLLAVHRDGVGPQERADRLMQVPWPAAQRERLRWVDDGQVLELRPWPRARATPAEPAVLRWPAAIGDGRP